jgi:hypothetical protein
MTSDRIAAVRTAVADNTGVTASDPSGSHVPRTADRTGPIGTPAPRDSAPTADSPEPTDPAATPPEALVLSAVEDPTEPRPGQPSHHSHSDFTSAVYGSVVAGTVIVSAGPMPPVGLAVLLVVSGVVFWLAHVYALTVAAVHGGWEFGAIRRGLAKEWPVAFAAIPPALAAVTAALFPDISTANGAWIALVVAIVEQQVWGYAAVRRSKLTGLAIVRTMTLNVVIGLVVVGLKFAVGH